jgi:putative hydrolase of HD superfamily
MLTDDIIRAEFERYLFNSQSDTLNTKIMKAAHIYASYWEFQIIRESNPTSYQNVRIETELLNSINLYKGLEGIFKLTNRHTISNFIDLYGQLRFQIRWAQTPRIPRTSVLGHSLLVACISYLLARENAGCSKRLYNAFFGGLFHDLPEAVTRDIISPLKRTSKDFEQLLKDIERELAETEIYPLIEDNWIDEIKYFTQDEFSNKVIIDGKVFKADLTIDIINEKYNEDNFNPYDGKIIRAADHLSAFLEAWNSIHSGIRTKDLEDAATGIKKDFGTSKIGKFDMSILYDDFKLNPS